MARPQCEDGFLMLAHELFAALSYAGFTKWEWAVIREVLAQSYGPKRTRTATVSPSDLAFRLGTYKESIVRACRTLVASGVLTREGATAYRFVKDYESWRAGENPRLSAPEIEDCRRTRTRNASTSTGNNGAPNPGTVALPHQQAPGTTALPTGTVALPNGSAGAPEMESPPMYPLLREEKNTHPKGGESILRTATERWGASGGDSIVSDLLRTFPEHIVKAACDAHWDRVQQRIHPGRLRAICREMFNGNWQMPGDGAARQAPSTIRPIEFYEPGVTPHPGLRKAGKA